MECMNFVKIYGCKRTGTNFIQTLLQLNCEDTVCFDNQFGDKHSPPTDDLSIFLETKGAKNLERIKYFQSVYKQIQHGSLHSIIMIKNPYSWHRSIKEFTNRKATLFNERTFEKEYTHYNYMYDECYKFYQDPQKIGNWYGKVIIVKYEDLLRITKMKTKSICKELDLPVKRKIIIPDKVPMSRLFTKEEKDFYLGKSFGLSTEEIRAVNKLVEPKVMKLYDYKRVYR